MVDDFSNKYFIAKSQLEEIDRLVQAKVLSRELCPEPGFLHWDVYEPDRLPEELQRNFEEYGEIRWYKN